MNKKKNLELKLKIFLTFNKLIISTVLTIIINQNKLINRKFKIN